MSISIPLPDRARGLSEPAIWLDLVLGHLPLGIFAVIETGLLAASALIATLIYPSAISWTLVLLVPLELLRRRSPAPTVESAQVKAAPMRRAWQPRYFLMRRLARIMAARAGITTPEIIVLNGQEQGEFNAAALQRPDGNAILVTKTFFTSDLAVILDDVAIAGMIAHEIGHLSRPALRARDHEIIRFNCRLSLILASLICILPPDPAPLAVPVIVAVCALTSHYLNRLGVRQEEIEADFVGASLFEHNGRSAMMINLFLLHFTDALAATTRSWSKRALAYFRRATDDAADFGLLSLSGQDLVQSYRSLEPGKRRIFKLRIWRLWLNYQRLRLTESLSSPFSDHPRNMAVATLMGIKQVDFAVVLDSSRPDLLRRQAVKATLCVGKDPYQLAVPARHPCPNSSETPR